MDDRDEYTLDIRDLDFIAEAVQPLWQEFRGSNVLIAGGTGFFGTWLAESFAWANRRYGLRASLTLLSRHPERALERRGIPFPRGVETKKGDIQTVVLDASYDWCIHAATEASASLNASSPLAMLDTIAGGTRRLLQALTTKPPRGFLLCSSGAVYGRQPPELLCIPESYLGGPDCSSPLSAYGEGRRYSEALGSIFAAEGVIPVKIARCFAFVGPWLPTDAHFAIGNFLGDHAAGRPIAIRGDGTTVRSYLYAGDLAIWLWKILVSARPGRPYNVGSETPVSIFELAELICSQGPTPGSLSVSGVSVSGQVSDRYVPCTSRARNELGLCSTVSLTDAVARTLEWLRRRQTG